jgi:hypothetical protein
MYFSNIRLLTDNINTLINQPIILMFFYILLWAFCRGRRINSFLYLDVDRNCMRNREMFVEGSWLWSYSNWIYIYLWNQHLWHTLERLWVWFLLMACIYLNVNIKISIEKKRKVIYWILDDRMVHSCVW